MKRIHSESLFATPANSDGGNTEFSGQLRDFITRSFAVQRQVDAAFVTELCWHIIHSPVDTIGDLAVHPKQAAKNGSQHLKLVLGKEFVNPELYYVDVPVYDKQLSKRATTKIPLNLPSVIYQEKYASHVDPPIAEEPQSSISRFDCVPWRGTQRVSCENMLCIVFVSSWVCRPQHKVVLIVLINTTEVVLIMPI